MPVDATPVHFERLATASAGRPDRAIVRALNRARIRRGLPRLRLSRSLTWAAGLHSLDLARRGAISHAGVDGSRPATRVRRVTSARLVGETIVTAPRGRPPAPRTVVRMWLRSPPHRRALLSRKFRRVGVARARGPRSVVITADFASAR